MVGSGHRSIGCSGHGSPSGITTCQKELSMVHDFHDNAFRKVTNDDATLILEMGKVIIHGEPGG